ncbi:NAD-dependent protein deacetylase sirtuin-2-like isoform X1 [Coccinella septempunctata]|uniref:NAD-dependent protein deacetylase sirtuin-2-like isoform X1 n=1 Tax=Coccinella septempunctata TaxID=41139 RepID=UPI001D05D37E|nr:NAD-dependent protein deacetylase sirtuin-2-like isoform X1 [Coccinella septempunctata]
MSEEDYSNYPSKDSNDEAGPSLYGVESNNLTESIESTIDNLRHFFLGRIGFDEEEDDQENEVQILDEQSLDGIVKYIQENKCQNIITMAGAGISTSAGIPDFRSPGSGLYHNLQKYNLPHPTAVFELSFFHENPRPFFELAKELYPGKFKPTPCHYFIKLLDDKGILLRHYTQNIDTLERVAGIPGDKIVEAHGTFHTGHCLKCQKEYPQEWMKEIIFRDEVPQCEVCSGVVKPDIVFFGENLPSRFHKMLFSDFPKCDLLIILGSSLAVQPFASLVDRVQRDCPRLLINRERAGQRSGLMALMGVRGGLDFENEKTKRDVFWLGDCDDGCQLLAEKLGWGAELNELIKKEYRRIDDGDHGVPENENTGTKEFPGVF